MRRSLEHPLVTAITDDVIDRVVAELRHLSRAASLQLALDVGAVVTDRIYGGDLKALRSRGQKDASFRKLAAHPELPISAASLWRAVSIYEISNRLPMIARARHLGVTHLRTVIGLPQDAQQRLLRAAESQRWTSNHLAGEVAAARVRTGRGGRPPLSPLVRSLRGLETFATLPIDPVSDARALARLTYEQARHVEKTLHNARLRCDALEAALRERPPDR